MAEPAKCKLSDEELARRLAALARALDQGEEDFSIKDPDAAADFIAVRRALRGEVAVDPDLRLAEELRREPA
jgi:hypothetical protein